MIDYTLKEMEAGDLVRYNDSFYTTLSSLKESPVLATEDSLDLLDRINTQDGHIFIAINNNYGIIGTSMLLIEQKFLRGGLKAGHIEDVATRAGFGGNGVAKGLIKMAVDFSKSEGCYKVILDCEEELVGFYEKFGFENSGTFLRLYLPH